MITRRDRIAVGIFVAASAGLLAAFLLVLWGLKASQNYKRYYVYTDSSVAGLSPSSTVKYLGVDAGRVDKMEFDQSSPPRVRLTLAISETAVVKSGTKAQLTPQGITGLQFIELLPPRPEKGKALDDLAPESEIEFAPSKFSDIVANIDRIASAANVFLGENKEKLSLTIDHANEFLTTSTRSVAALTSKVDAIVDENRVSVRGLLDKARTAVDDTSRVMADVQDRHLVEEINHTIQDARSAIRELEGAVKDARAELASARMGEAIADVRSTARSANDLLAAATGRVNDDLEETGRVLEELRRTVASIKQLAHEVSTRPALLVRDLEQPRRSVEDK